MALGTLTTSDTVTVTVSTAAVAWTTLLVEITPSAGHKIAYFNAADGTGGNSSNPTVTTSGNASGNLLLGVVFDEYGTAQTFTDDSDTSGGSWSTGYNDTVGTTTSGVSVHTQWKSLTSGGVQTFNPTLGTGADWTTAWIEFTENPIPSPSTATLTFTGYQPSLFREYFYSPSTSAMTITGYDFTADVPASDTNIDIGVGSVTTSTSDLVLDFSYSLATDVGSLAFTTYDLTADISDFSFNIPVTEGTIATTPYTPSIAFQDAIGAGLISTEGYTATLIYSINGSTGELIAASYAPSLAYTYDQSTGSVTFSTYDLVVNESTNISIPVGRVSIVVPYDFAFTPDTATLTTAGEAFLAEVYKIIYVGEEGISDYDGYFTAIPPFRGKIRYTKKKKFQYRLRAA